MDAPVGGEVVDVPYERVICLPKRKFACLQVELVNIGCYACLSASSKLKCFRQAHMAVFPTIGKWPYVPAHYPC